MLTTVTRIHVRTTQEIAADRKAATAFFARFDGYFHTDNRSTKWRDIRKQIIEREVFDYKLLLAAAESHEWSQRHKDGPKVRAARRALAELRDAGDTAELVMDLNQLREYVHPGKRWTLPEPRLGEPTPAERRTARRLAQVFWGAANDPHKSVAPVAYRLRSVEDERTPLALWLLLEKNWDYGINRIPAGFDGHLTAQSVHRSSLTQYQPNKIVTVGMTPEKALAIAVRVAEAEDANRRSSDDIRAAAAARRADAEKRRLERAARIETHRTADVKNAARVAADRELEARQNY